MSLELVLKTGNGMIQTGSGIITPISWAPIKKLFFYKMCLTLTDESGTGFVTSASRLHQDFL